MHQVIGRQTFVLAVALQEPVINSRPSPLRPRDSCRKLLGQSPTDRKAFLEVQGYRGEIPAKIHRFGWLEWMKGTAWLCLHHHSLKAGKFRAETFWVVISPTGKERAGKCMASPAVLDVSRELHFSLTASKVLNLELCKWEVGGEWESSRKALRDMVLADLIVDSIRKPTHPQASGKSSPENPLNWSTGTPGNPSTSPFPCSAACSLCIRPKQQQEWASG